MHVIVDFVIAVLGLLYSYVEAFVRLFISRQHKSIVGENVLITGSAQGLGREMAIRFYMQGANLILIDINEKANSDLVVELKSLNVPSTNNTKPKVMSYRCNLCDSDDVARVGELIIDDFKHVDMLVNNAGVVRCAPFEKLTRDDIKQTFEVNCLAHFWMIKQFLPGMLDRKKGHIVAISSIAGLIGTTNLVDYCASKFAVTGMMDALSREFESSNREFIKLTTICPIGFDSGMFKAVLTRFPWLLPYMTLDFTAESCLDAILTEETLVTIPRNTYYIFHLGQKLIPSKGLRALRRFIEYEVGEH